MTATDLATAGRRFRDARRRSTLTQGDVAGVAHLARSSVTNFEAGRQDIPLSKVLVMCWTVGIGIGHLGTVGDTNPLEETRALALNAKALTASMAALQAQVDLLAAENERLAKLVDRQRARLLAVKEPS